MDGSGYFNPDAFTLPLPGELGDAGRNTIPGPWSWSLNTAFGRYFTIGGEGSRKRIELRLETTNTLNHVNITNVNTVVGSTRTACPPRRARCEPPTSTSGSVFRENALPCPTCALRIILAALACAGLLAQDQPAKLQDQHEPGHHQRVRQR